MTQFGKTESAHSSSLINFMGTLGLNFSCTSFRYLFPLEVYFTHNFNHSMWMSETPLMAKTLQPYPKQSKISELHELTFQSLFGSLRATICSFSLLYICIPISYCSLPIGICETPKNPDFLRKDKMVISVEIQNFSRSQKTKRTSLLESSCEI